jgi:hypothetical protein
MILDNNNNNKSNTVMYNNQHNIFMGQNFIHNQIANGGYQNSKISFFKASDQKTEVYDGCFNQDFRSDVQ